MLFKIEKCRSVALLVERLPNMQKALRLMPASHKIKHGVLKEEMKKSLKKSMKIQINSGRKGIKQFKILK